jgi:hypothetical protein
MQGAHGAILLASGQTLWVINRLYSGIPTPTTWMEQPTLTQTSGAVTGKITNPSEQDVMIEPGHYLDEYKVFHIASGVVVNQYDMVKPAGTGDYFIVTEPCSYYTDGVQTRERIQARRTKID